jgi:hypothetical protein
MLVCINAAGETLCPLIVTTDRSTLGVFRDGIEENVDLKVLVGQSAHVNAILFHDYLRDVLIPRIEIFMKGMKHWIHQRFSLWTTVPVI